MCADVIPITGDARYSRNAETYDEVTRSHRHQRCQAATPLHYGFTSTIPGGGYGQAQCPNVSLSDNSVYFNGTW